GRPTDGVFDIALRIEHVLFHRRIERPHRFAFAENFQSDALANVTLRTPILDERLSGPAQHVDKTRRDRQPLSMDLSPATRGTQLTNRADPVSLDRDVPRRRRVPASIVNCAVAND